MRVFGYFREERSDYPDSFADFQKIRNTLPKNVILEYMKRLPYYSLAPGMPEDFMTHEPLSLMGQIKDGEFIFSIEFLHYFEKYDIGIPLDYEQYLIREKHLIP